MIFKLSMSPYDTAFTPASIVSPMSDNDYDAIPLWYAHKEEGFSFSRSLWRRMVLSRKPDFEGDTDDLLGPSLFDEAKMRSRELSYGAESEQVSRFERLAQKDRSFAQYLAENRIDLTTLSAASPTSHAADVRKVGALVAVRDAFRTSDVGLTGDPHRRLRSRKNPGLYSGADAIFAMVEGNPRWLIAIGSRLLDAFGSARIPAFAQNLEVARAARRFGALLRTIPGPKLQGASGYRGGVQALMDKIGRFIFNSVVLDDFTPDPVGSFRVDDEITTDVLDSLGKALNAGAIVYVPEKSDDVLLRDLHGKRFRLSYLLSVTYKIPIRLGRDVTLTHILGSPPRMPKEQRGLFRLEPDCNVD